LRNFRQIHHLLHHHHLLLYKDVEKQSQCAVLGSRRRISNKFHILWRSPAFNNRNPQVVGCDFRCLSDRAPSSLFNLWFHNIFTLICQHFTMLTRYLLSVVCALVKSTHPFPDIFSRWFVRLWSQPTLFESEDFCWCIIILSSLDNVPCLMNGLQEFWFGITLCLQAKWLVNLSSDYDNRTLRRIFFKYYKTSLQEEQW